MYRFVYTNYGLFWTCHCISVLWGLVALSRRPNQKSRSSLLWGCLPFLCCGQITRGNTFLPGRGGSIRVLLCSCQGFAARSSSWLRQFVVAGMCPSRRQRLLAVPMSQNSDIGKCYSTDWGAETQNRGGKRCFRTSAVLYQKKLLWVNLS